MRMTNSPKHVIAVLALFFLGYETILHGFITSYSRNDPYPVFTSLDPQTYLQTREKLRLKGYELDVDRNEWFGFSISPFGQNASITRIDCLSPLVPIEPPTTACIIPCNEEDTCLGNINGRWNMIALLFDTPPQGCTLPPALQEAKTTLFPNMAVVDDPLYIDNAQRVGFFDVPMHYRKRGLRFDFKAQISCDFGLSFNFGIADIFQEARFVDRTPPPAAFDGTLSINNCRNIRYCELEETLMKKLCCVIAPEICLNLSKFHHLSVEDLRGGIYWRHAFPINFRSEHWEPFLLIPWVHAEGSVAVGKERNYNHFTALSFGSNDHNAVGISAGMNIDFTKTIEVGGEAGITHFFGRDVCHFPMPNSCYQSGIYPFTTDVRIEPAHNWYFGLKMLAYHFLGDLSFYFQYIIIQHEKDCIILKKPDPAFHPEVLINRSCWKSQLANIGFNYDISPTISLGFLWQTPLPSRNTYRSTTVMLSFNAQY